MRRFAVLVAWVALSTVASAQTQPPAGTSLPDAPAPVPQSHVPSPVLLELRTLESQFDLALAQDCAPERCFSKGCVYRDHVTVDMPRTSSLPGLGQTEGPGSVPPQEYLTQAQCEFTHEKSVPTQDVQALVRRLEQRLSKGWLKVKVGRQILQPISPGLRESPPPPEPPKPPAPVVEEKPVEPPAPPTWEAGVALRELWVSLLPHFSWMIALVMLTMATLTVIWALRRLGRETLEEKALAAQLAAGSLDKPAEAETPPNAEEPSPDGADPAPSKEDAETAFVTAQQQLWNDRIAQAELAKGESVVVELLRDWLKAGEFELLAKAIFVFGDRLSLAFTSDGELAVRKVEFAGYLKTVDEKALLSDAEFFRLLNQHAISSTLMAQADAEVYRSLREEFGSNGVANLIDSLSPRHGALLFGHVPTDCQQDVARIMSPELRVRIANELLASNRISKEETVHLFEVLDAARAGKPLPPAPPAQGILDRGRQFDAAGALSVLLPLIESSERGSLFARALGRSGGTLPLWYQDILYGDMLLKLPDELQRDLLLDVDVRGLAGWSSVQQPAWQESFIARLAPAMQSAIRANMSFVSREEQLRAARRGQNELISAVKKQVARGKVSFAEIIS
ncbi:hypothetical protein JRI60_18245 [Archangium violaceum]|uniref:hypothetical protein n=1 Tax=Archangium violaceum TaxID=83451 RepID=UPI00194E433B|nr:hypothetical protein [Archangium violaceum]QRO00830.1 hypothetical protein JRI60_18245 [Archangium violaceum]